MMPTSSVPTRSLREQATRLAGELPVVPTVFNQLSALLVRDQVDLQEVSEWVALDPGLAGAVLSRANTLHFRGTQQVTSVNEATARLGVTEVHRVIGLLTASRLFASGLPLYQMTAEAMWSNAVVGALAMEALSRRGEEDGHEAYTLGLLRQVGKLALNQVVVREKWNLFCPVDVDVIHWEKVRFEVNHLEVAAAIFSAWRMPTRLAQAVLHCIDLAPPDKSRHAAHLHLANWIVEQMNLHVPAEYGMWKLNAAVCHQAGLKEEQVQSAMDETQTEWAALQESLEGVVPRPA